MSHRFFERAVGIYFDDLDPMQVLHNARYLLLFERTLGAFWMDRGLGAFGDSDRPDQFHMVCHNEVTYLAPVRGVGRVRVRLWVERIGRTSLTFAFRLLAHDRDHVHATGGRTVVHVDSETLRPTPWSEPFRRRSRHLRSLNRMKPGTRPNDRLRLKRRPRRRRFRTNGRALGDS